MPPPPIVPVADAEKLLPGVSLTDEALDRLYRLSDAVGETLCAFAASRARQRDPGAVSVSAEDVAEVERLLVQTLRDLAEREGLPVPSPPVARPVPPPPAEPDAVRHTRSAAA